MSVVDKLDKPGPYKLLALDGGGIRGLITIETLARIEHLLRDALGRDETFVLADYFDYIAGTSTGAIIATRLALSMPVAKIRDFYLDNSKQMFERSGLLTRLLFHRYKDFRLARRLKAELGAGTTLGSSQLRTLLLLIWLWQNSEHYATGP